MVKIQIWYNQANTQTGTKLGGWDVGLTEGEVFVVLNPDLAGIVPGWEVEDAQLCGKLQASQQCLSDIGAVRQMA